MADDVIAKHEKDSAELTDDTVNDASSMTTEVKLDDLPLSPNGKQSKKFPGLASRTTLSQSKSVDSSNSVPTNKNGIPHSDDMNASSQVDQNGPFKNPTTVVVKDDTSSSKITLLAPSKS